jgi:hypothetical protein
MESLILQLQTLVANNDLDPALKKLHSICSLSNAELVNDVIMVSARHKKLLSEVRKGVIGHAEENLEHNKITQAVLSLIEEIRDDPERFTAYHTVETELDLSVQQRAHSALSPGVKDALFERLAYVKEKALAVPALWIDESPAANQYESHLLASAGLRIDYARSSDEAWRMLGEKSYELILSEINRGGIPDEGLRFHRRLISERIDLPLIFYTGRADRSKGVPPFAFGIADLPNELMHLVLDVLARR